MIRKSIFFVALLASVVASVNPAFADRRRHYGRHVHVDVDVHRRGSGVGTFIAGAIVGGAISSATRPPTTVVVVPQQPVYVAPQMGVIVPMLPGGCTQIMGGGVVYQRCGSVFYQPFYQGGGVVYRVVAPF